MICLVDVVSYDFQVAIITREVTLQPLYVPRESSGSTNEFHVVRRVPIANLASTR